MIKDIIIIFLGIKIIGALSVIIFDFNITVRGINWASEDNYINVFVLIFSFLLMLGLIYLNKREGDKG